MGIGKSLALLSAALGVLMTFIVLQKIAQKPADTSEGATYYGVVLDENENGVANATIEIKDASDSTRILGFGQTLPNGEFSILVKDKPGSTVWIKINKTGYKDFTSMKDLSGNDKVILTR